MMTQEHDAAGTLLADIRDLSHGFTTPEGCVPHVSRVLRWVEGIRAGSSPAYSSGEQYPVSSRNRSGGGFGLMSDYRQGSNIPDASHGRLGQFASIPHGLSVADDPLPVITVIKE